MSRVRVVTGIAFSALLVVAAHWVSLASEEVLPPVEGSRFEFSCNYGKRVQIIESVSDGIVRSRWKKDGGDIVTVEEYDANLYILRVAVKGRNVLKDRSWQYQRSASAMAELYAVAGLEPIGPIKITVNVTGNINTFKGAAWEEYTIKPAEKKDTKALGQVNLYPVHRKYANAYGWKRESTDYYHPGLRTFVIREYKAKGEKVEHCELTSYSIPGYASQIAKAGTEIKPDIEAAAAQPAKSAGNPAGSNVVTSSTPQPVVAPSAPDPEVESVELTFWESIKDSTSAGDYLAYLQTFPNGHFVALARFRAEKYAQETKVQEASSGTSQPLLSELVAEVGRYHAIVIGNNDYRYVGKLQMAVNDAVAVAEVLERLYGFDVQILLNATRYSILKAISGARANLSERDNLLIYYAGHGIVDETTGRGYWLPVDAEPNVVANWIPNTTISDMLAAIASRHAIVVADSCYSGALVRSVPARLETGAETAALLWRLARKRSRTALTSGGLEPVLDKGGGNHSVFTSAFLDALYENDGVIEGQSLFAAIQRRVVVNSEQTPEYSDIRGAGHDGGDFLFVRQ